MNILKGKLTYMVAGAMFLWALAGLLLGQLENEAASALMLNAMAVFGIRRAL